MTAERLGSHDEVMTEAARKILSAFETLPEEDRDEVAVEIVHRVSLVQHTAPSEEELLLAADEVFLELDRCEGAG